jgi:hypothetical protein
LNAVTARSSPGTQAQNTTGVHELAAAVLASVVAEAAPPDSMAAATAPAMAAAAYLVPEPLNAVDIFLAFISSYSFLA